MNSHKDHGICIHCQEIIVCPDPSLCSTSHLKAHYNPYDCIEILLKQKDALYKKIETLDDNYRWEKARRLGLSPSEF
jgi:hypothetical protein